MKRIFRRLVARRAVGPEDSLVREIRAKVPNARGAAIFLHKGLGDLVVALPALRALRELGPVKFFLADGRFVRFLEREGIPAEEIYPRDRPRFWTALLGGQYDYCINFNSIEISYETRLMMILANAKLNVGYDSGPLRELVQLVPSGTSDRYMGDVFGDLARTLGCVVDLKLGRPLQNPDGDVILHLGGRLDETGFDKRWPAVKFTELAARCVGHGIPVKLLWGPGDSEPPRSPEGRIQVQFCATTGDLFREVEKARLFVCNNTGVLWMASLAGVSTISFGAPFFFPRWDPRAMRKESSEVILGNPDCACIDYRCAHGNCIGEVTVDQVFAKILERLQHSP